MSDWSGKTQLLGLISATVVESEPVLTWRSALPRLVMVTVANLVVAVPIELPEARYASVESRLAFFDRLTQSLAAAPGIDGAAVTTAVPPLDETERLVEVNGPVAIAPPRFASTVRISPTFFAVVGRPMLYGRNFTIGDGMAGAEVAIVNERFVVESVLGGNPIGRQIRFAARRPRPRQPPEGASLSV